MFLKLCLLLHFPTHHNLPYIDTTAKYNRLFLYYQVQLCSYYRKTQLISRLRDRVLECHENAITETMFSPKDRVYAEMAHSSEFRKTITYKTARDIFSSPL